MEINTAIVNSVYPSHLLVLYTMKRGAAMMVSRISTYMIQNHWRQTLQSRMRLRKTNHIW